MSVGIPGSSKQVEDRIKADVQREAPDSNPYLIVHWLRSLIAGIARRIYDFYLDLRRTETRLFPDTADAETAPRWGNIFVGAQNPATQSNGQLVATGTVGGAIGTGVSLTANGIEFITTSGDTIANRTAGILSITRSGSIATVTTGVDHNLSSSVPVTITGSDQSEYNVVDSDIVVTGARSFTFDVAGTPVTPATGSMTAAYTTANVNVQSVEFGSNTNLDGDTPVSLQSPIVNVDNTLSVTFGTIGGGTDAESIPDYKARYLERIRNPIAQFNPAAITFQAKTVPGVTRVFVERAGTVIDQTQLSGITRTGNVATATSVSPHGFNSGQEVSISGAIELEYNVVDARIIVESGTVFHYVVAGSPSTPATGSMFATMSIPPGQSRTFFMRDNDSDPIPSLSEVADVKAAIDAIVPVNTSLSDNIVLAPTPTITNFVFSALSPDTSTMRSAINQNLIQFFEEQTSVGITVDEDAYRSAIINTVDPDTGDVVTSFELSTPSGDINPGSGGIVVLGSVGYAI